MHTVLCFLVCYSVVYNVWGWPGSVHTKEICSYFIIVLTVVRVTANSFILIAISHTFEVTKVSAHHWARTRTRTHTHTRQVNAPVREQIYGPCSGLCSLFGRLYSAIPTNPSILTSDFISSPYCFPVSAAGPEMQAVVRLWWLGHPLGECETTNKFSETKKLSQNVPWSSYMGLMGYGPYGHLIMENLVYGRYPNFDHGTIPTPCCTSDFSSSSWRGSGSCSLGVGKNSAGLESSNNVIDSLTWENDDKPLDFGLLYSSRFLDNDVI